MKKLYTWWSKYMFWSEEHGFPWRGEPDVPDEPVENRTLLILGHRGSSANYPENTMLAFRKAVEEGAHGVETDIYITKDREYVLIHDDTVDRTTNGVGRVADLTLAEIKELDAGSWAGGEFEGRQDTKIPTLIEFLDEFNGKDVFLSLQVKLWEMEDFQGIIDLVVERNMLHQVFIFGSHYRLGLVKAYNPDVFVMNAGTEEPSFLLGKARTENWNAISLTYENTESDFVKTANDYGIYVQTSYVWTKYEDTMNFLINSNVNFILGNDCQAMVDIANAKGISQIIPGEL